MNRTYGFFLLIAFVFYQGYHVSGSSAPGPKITVEPEDLVLFNNRVKRLHCQASNTHQISLICNNTVWFSKPSESSLVKHKVKLHTRKITYSFIRSMVDKESLLCYCEARHFKPYQSVKSRRVLIQVAYLSKDVTITVNDVALSTGNNFALTCQADGVPVPNLSLYKETGTGNWVKLSVQHDLVYSGRRLSLVKKAEINDSGNYSCSASNLVNREFSDVIKVFVYEPLNVSCDNGIIHVTKNATISWQNPFLGPLHPPRWQNVNQTYTPAKLAPPWMANEDNIQTLKESSYFVHYEVRDNFGQCAKCIIDFFLNDSVTFAQSPDPEGASSRHSQVLTVALCSVSVLVVLISIMVALVKRQRHQLFKQHHKAMNHHHPSAFDSNDHEWSSDDCSVDQILHSHVITSKVDEWCIEAEPVCFHASSSNSVTRNKKFTRENSNKSLPPFSNRSSRDSRNFFFPTTISENIDSCKEFEMFIPKKADPYHYSWGEMDCNGGRLTLEDLDITLTVPAGAIPAGKVVCLYLTILDKKYLQESTPLGKGESRLSHVIMCGPNNMKFLKPVLLAFPQSARFIQNWDIMAKSSEADHDDPPDWKTVYHMNKPEDSTDTVCIVNEQSCTLLTNHFTLYCLCGIPCEDSEFEEAKLEYKVVPFSQFGSDCCRLRIYLLNSFESIEDIKTDEETNYNSRMCSPAYAINVCKHAEPNSNGDDHDINFEITVHSQQWNLLPSADARKQVVRYRKLFATSTLPLYVSYMMTSSDMSGRDICCQVIVTQNGFPADGVLFDIHEQHPRNTSNTVAVQDQPRLYTRGRRQSSTSSGTSMTLPLQYYIPDDVRHQLCVLLDTMFVLGLYGWQKLALEINVGKYYIQLLQSPTETDRADHILEVFESNCYRSNLQAGEVKKELLRIFRKIERHDCVEIVENAAFSQEMHTEGREAQENDEIDSGFLDQQDDQSYIAT